MRIFRHGDVILREVEVLPENAKEAGDELSIVGETGHAHVLKKVRVVTIPDWTKFIVVPKEGAAITHPEHPTLELPPLLIARVERVRSEVPYKD